MEALAFFAGIPTVFGLFQFFVTRSRLPRKKKWLPALMVGLCALTCLGGMTDVLPLPNTYWFDGGGGFIAFPDFWYVGLFCAPALLGLAIGAVMALATRGGTEK